MNTFSGMPPESTEAARRKKIVELRAVASSHVMCRKAKTAHGSSEQEGCAARSRQGSVARVSKQRAHSVRSAAAAAVTRVLFEQHDRFPRRSVRRVREDSRGDDASEVVREVVRRVEAAVLGAVAPALPAGGTAGKEAEKFNYRSMRPLTRGCRPPTPFGERPSPCAYRRSPSDSPRSQSFSEPPVHF